MRQTVLEMYEQLIAISRRAADNGHYEVAFHTLSAALHCVEKLKDENYLLTVEKEVEQQRAFIKAHIPTHRMSSQAAAQRGGRNIYVSLIAQAKVHIRQLRYERHQAKRPWIPWPNSGS